MLLKTPRRGGGFRASRAVLDAVEMIVCSNPFEDQLRGLISSLDGVVQFLWSDTSFLASPRSYICTLQDLVGATASARIDEELIVAPDLFGKQAGMDNG